MIGAVLIAAALTLPPAGTYTYSVSVNGAEIARTALTIEHGGDGTDFYEAATANGQHIATHAHFDSSGAETAYNIAANGTAVLRATVTDGNVLMRTPAVHLAAIRGDATQPIIIDSGLGGPMAMLRASIVATHANAFTMVTTRSPRAVHFTVATQSNAARPSTVPASDAVLAIVAEGVTQTLWYDPSTYVVDAADGTLSYRLLSRSAALAPETVPTIAPEATPRPSAFSSREVTFASRDGSSIAGTISYPGGDASHLPAVVLVGGSGTHDRDESIGPYHPLFDIAEGLNAHGFAVLRYDKRFAGESSSNTSAANLTRQNYLDDLLVAIAALRKDTRVDTRQLYLVGHSEGGELVMGAVQEGAPVRGIAMLAPLPIPYAQALQDQQSRGMISAGDLAQIEEAEAGFLASWKSIDPRAEVARIGLPMLVVRGGADVNVTAQELAQLTQAAKRAKRSFSIVQLDGDDHFFRHGQSPFDPQVVTVLVRWLDGVRRL